MSDLPDPTYIKEEIEKNPVWELAFVLSEIQNDNAPIGWSKYIYIAECLRNHFEIRALSRSMREKGRAFFDLEVRNHNDKRLGWFHATPDIAVARTTLLVDFDKVYRKAREFLAEATDTDHSEQEPRNG